MKTKQIIWWIALTLVALCFLFMPALAFAQTNDTGALDNDIPSIVMPGASALFDSLLQLGPLALLAALILFGSYLVRASALANRCIPWLAAIAGAILLQFLFPVAQLQDKWANPRVVIGIYGFIVSVFVWMIHEFALSRFEDFLAAKGLFPKRLTRAGHDTDIATVIEHAKLMESQAEQLTGVDKEYTAKVAAAMRRLAA